MIDFSVSERREFQSFIPLSEILKLVSFDEDFSLIKFSLDCRVSYLC